MQRDFTEKVKEMWARAEDVMMGLERRAGGWLRIKAHLEDRKEWLVRFCTGGFRRKY